MKKIDETTALAIIITMVGVVLVVVALAFHNQSRNNAFKICIESGYSDQYCNMMLGD